MEEVIRLFNHGHFAQVEPIFHRSFNDIDDIDEHINAPVQRIIPEGLSIIEVPMDDLVQHFDELYAPIVREPHLFRRDQIRETLCEILLEWEEAVPLTPPMVLFRDKHFQAHPMPNKIWVHDGKHRLSVAHALGAERIVVIVPTHQVEQFSTTFNDVIVIEE
ncbi:MAG: hypothetical protein GC178_01470 [Flavobacteriales bacterium]|nr:hypothetical protein [Flavobacteriales bacterium]